MEEITVDDFKKVEIKIGEIISAENIDGSEKLLKLMVSFGLKPAATEVAAGSPKSEEKDIRQILSGIKKYVTPESLIGLKCAFVTNLPPREMMGLTSEGMILAASTSDGQFTLLKADQNIPAGTSIK
ncbi:MAG: hypothetical protein Q7S34_01870 [bacterium]|nr:hypothetical protein [bacterium]